MDSTTLNSTSNLPKPPNSDPVSSVPPWTMSALVPASRQWSSRNSNILLVLCASLKKNVHPSRASSSQLFSWKWESTAPLLLKSALDPCTMQEWMSQNCGQYKDRAKQTHDWTPTKVWCHWQQPPSRTWLPPTPSRHLLECSQPERCPCLILCQPLLGNTPLGIQRPLPTNHPLRRSPLASPPMRRQPIHHGSSFHPPPSHESSTKWSPMLLTLSPSLYTCWHFQQHWHTPCRLGHKPKVCTTTSPTRHPPISEPSLTIINSLEWLHQTPPACFHWWHQQLTMPTTRQLVPRTNLPILESSLFCHRS